MAAFSVQDAQSQRFLPVENSPALLFSISMGGKDEGYTYIIRELPQTKPVGFDSSLREGAFGMAGKYSAKPQSGLPGRYPFRLLTAFAATFPKGTAFGGGGKVSGIAQRRPLGGAGAVGD